MELYGSLSNISGSVSASYFTGSYIGDGAGLYNLPASGVTGLNLSQIASGSVTASVNPSGFNVNTSASITGSLNVSGTVLSQTTPLVSGSSQINITGTTGYSTFSSSIATTDSNQESRLNLIETSTGSLNSFSSSIDTTIKNKLNIDGVISGSSQILNGSNIVSSSAQVSAYGFATTGSNLFIGTQTHSGSILPSVDNAYDLGSATYQWRDVYISSGSLYIDGTKVIGSTAQELTITTDTGQSIKILEGTTDSIILQTADGDIELKSSADGDILLDPTNGKIMLKGPIEILNGQKIQSSVGGTPVVFANDIVVSGSIDITGTIEGINLTDFSSSLNTRLGNLESSGGSLNSFTASAISRLNSLESTTSSLNSYTSSNNTRLNTIESTTGSLNSYTSSTNTKLSSIETTTSSIISVNTTQNSRLDSLETTSGSILSTNTAQSSRLDSIEGKTGSYATTGSNIFQGTQTITGSLYISQDLVVAGSSSIQNISSSIVNIADNIITVNALNPSVRFGGLAVIDSGSSPQVSGSMLFDSVNNQWLFVHQNQGTVTSSVLLMGPETYNNLGNEAYITTNRLVKSTGIEHLADSNITDTGTKVSINSNTEITGSLISTANVTSNANLVSNYSVGDEGGEINLNKPVTNTTLNSGITIDVWRDRVRIFESGGTNRGGYFDIAGLSTGASTNLMGTAATASYVEYTNVANKPALVSGSSQISFNSISDKPTLVSGSSQITYGSISGVPSGIVSGSSQVSFNGITDKPTLVSGSSQITYGSISGIPGGIVSGSVQVDLTATTNYSSGIKTRLNAEGVLSSSAQVVASLPAGTVSGSSQITYGSISGIPSGIVSGSSQISFGSISGVPSGLVSGSSQITLSSTTGYSSVLNQAVLTSSSPTFAGITSTAGITVSGTSYYTFNKPSTASYQTVALFGSTANGIFLTSDSGIISRGAYYNNGWIATDTFGSYLNFNTSTGGMDLNVFSGATVNSTASFSSLFTVARNNFSFGGNAIIHAGNYTTYTYAASTDSEQQISGRQFYFNNGAGRMNMDPRWNESGYDTDLGTLHIWAWTAAGAAYGRAGIALYNDSAYQYLTTKTGQNNLFVNNNAILHAGNYSSYALPLGGGTVTGKVNIGTGGSTNGGLLNITGEAHNQINVTTNTSWGLLVGFCNEASVSGYHGPLSAALINVQNGPIHLGTNNSSNIQVSTSGHLHPTTNNTYDLGTSSLAWRNVYTNDLHLSNMNKPEGNDVDGTNGNWTIQEGAENLYIINNNNGKKYKIKLEEI